jgi:hypothetical protein
MKLLGDGDEVAKLPQLHGLNDTLGVSRRLIA